MPSVRRSLVLSFAQKYTSLLITIPTVMVLARFLTPAETGIFSVALALTNMAQMLRDFGVGDYLIQERDLDRDKLRTAFTITAIMGTVMALAIFFAAPAVGRFYGGVGVEKVMRVVAMNFLLIPVGSCAFVMMRRELAYGSIYIKSTAESLTRSAVSVSMAVVGFSYMSLAWGSLAGIVAGVIATAFLRPRYVLLFPSLRQWRAVLSFGHKMVIVDVLETLARNSNDIVLGRTLGFSATGLFSRGAGLVNMFVTNFQGAITSVAYPMLAQRSRDGWNLGKVYAKSIAYMTAIAWPFYVFAAIMAHPIILAAYGSQWIAAVPVLRLVAMAGAVSTLYLYSSQLLTATGHLNSRLFATVIAQPLRIVLTIAAAFYSIEMVAAVSIVMAFVSMALYYRQMRKHLDLHFSAVVQASYTSAAIAAVSNIVPVAVMLLATAGRLRNPWVELVYAGAGWGVGWVFSVFVFRHPLRAEVLSAWERLHKRFSLGRPAS